MTRIIGKPPAPKGGATFRVVNEPMGRPRFPWRVVCPSGLMLPGFTEEWQARQCADGPAQYAPVTCGRDRVVPRGTPVCTAADALAATEVRGG